MPHCHNSKPGATINDEDDCHRILVPKSQVESILQCFGLIFILMDRLGALWSALGANLEKERFFRDTLYVCSCDKIFLLLNSSGFDALVASFLAVLHFRV